LYVWPVAVESIDGDGSNERALEVDLELKSSRARAWRGLKVIGSSTKVHVVDALAITGEEGRGSLRKAAGSWQTSIDPQISEWGNPLREGVSLPEYIGKRRRTT
jgi:hypothetical protein